MVQVQFASGSACGGETRVVAATPGMDHCDIVGTPQIVTERLGARVGPVVIGARQQIIDQVAVQIQLQLWARHWRRPQGSLEQHPDGVAQMHNTNHIAGVRLCRSIAIAAVCLSTLGDWVGRMGTAPSRRRRRGTRPGS
jgi:hypothetical protein